jgi:hypothetical protein
MNRWGKRLKGFTYEFHRRHAFAIVFRLSDLASNEILSYRTEATFSSQSKKSEARNLLLYASHCPRVLSLPYTSASAGLLLEK